jgi:FG-GAP repeat
VTHSTCRRTAFPQGLSFPIPFNFGYLRAYSGLNGNLLFQVNHLGGAHGNQGEYFGVNVASLGDVNGDGAGDVLVGAPQAVKPPLIAVGRIEVYSGIPLPLAGEAHVVSLAQGGTPDLWLNAGSAHANALYLVLGSFSGTQPGIAVEGLTVPLVWDAYTAWTVSSPNQAPLAQSLSLLTGTGRGQTTITIPPGAFSSIAGQHVFHAYVLLEGGTISFVSNAVPLTFWP